MVSEIPRVSVFGHYPYSVTFPLIVIFIKLNLILYNLVSTKELYVYVDYDILKM